MRTTKIQQIELDEADEVIVKMGKSHAHFRYHKDGERTVFHGNEGWTVTIEGESTVVVESDNPFNTIPGSESEVEIEHVTATTVNL